MAGYSVTYTVVDNATKQIDAINRRIAQMRAPMDRMSRSISRFVDVSGLRKVAEGFGWIARAAATAFRAMIAIVPVLGAITSAATIAGMVKLVATFSAWGRQLTINADQIGVSSQKLQQFEDAARLAGGTADEMTESLKGLHDATVRALEGQDPQTLAYFNQLGIHLRDANGQMRTTADLLPEVMQKLQDIKDPTDRARIATALLGGAGTKLVESLRVSGKALGDWMNDASKFTELTQAQLQDMIKYEQAQGRLGVAFDHLGQQVAAVLAKNFIPLFDHLSGFVQQNQPQIIAAVDRISAEFAKWLDNPDMWKNVGEGITKMIDGLQFVIDHLDTVMRVAETIAILFAVKWGVGIVASIAQVVAALGSLGGGAAAGAVGGSGLLGALGAVATIAGALAAIAGVYAGNKMGQRSIEDQAKGMGFEQKSGGWFGMPTFHNPTTGEDLTYDQMLERQGRPHGRTDAQRWLFGPDQPGGQQPQAPGAQGSLQGALGITPEQYRTFAGSIAQIEHASYGQMGGSSGRFAGRYQMGAAEIAETARSLGEAGPSQATFLADPSMQERYFERYSLNHHRQLMDDPRYAALSPEDKAAVLGYAHNQGVGGARRWLDSGVAGRDAFGTSGTAYSDLIKRNLAAGPPVASAPPAALPVPPIPPVNGSVDVSITHRNPPPDAAVTATGSGTVNVAPPRVEHAQLADI